MQHIYTVFPPHCQPQGPANDNKPKSSLLDKVVMVVGISFFALMFIGLALLGLYSMTGKP